MKTNGYSSKRSTRREKTMICEVCQQGPPNGPTIYRVNAPGEMPARWRCTKHLTPEQKQAIDPDTKAITEAIEAEARICKACDCLIDRHGGCGCNPHDA